MPIENLTAGVQSLKNAYEKMNSKREAWTQTTKPLLSSTLEKITEKFDLNWEVYNVDHRHNLEAVQLSFGKSNSGITERTEYGQKSFTKNGGILSFTQTYNGDVLVLIFTPSIDEVVEQDETFRIITKRAPDQIDEEFVYVQVGKFITEMVAWETALEKKAAL